jgi:Na+/H+ antiporter NhaC
MSRKEKKVSWLAGDQSPKWYVYYTVFSLLIVAGFFYMFYHYSNLSVQAVTGLQTLDINAETVEDAINLRYNVPDISTEQTTPPTIYIAIVLVVLGTMGFLTTKYFYEKSNKGVR